MGKYCADSDQNAPRGAALSGSVLFAISLHILEGQLFEFQSDFSNICASEN